MENRAKIVIMKYIFITDKKVSAHFFLYDRSHQYQVHLPWIFFQQQELELKSKQNSHFWVLFFYLLLIKCTASFVQ